MVFGATCGFSDSLAKANYRLEPGVREGLLLVPCLHSASKARIVAFKALGKAVQANPELAKNEQIQTFMLQAAHKNNDENEGYER